MTRSVRHHDFVNFDDHQYVTENPAVAGGLTGDAVLWTFTTGHAGNWHPLTWLSHFLVALAGQGELEDAVRHFSEALRLTPDYGEAVQELLAALRIEPGAADLHYDLSLLLARQGQTAEALHLEIVLKLEPAHPAAWRALETLSSPRFRP